MNKDKPFKLSRFLIYVLCSTICLSLVYSCSDDKPVPDTDHINADIKLLRFEQDYRNVNLENWDESWANLEKKYPGFLQVYFSRIMADIPVPEDSIKSYAYEIAEQQFLNPLHDSVMLTFPDLKPYMDELEPALKLYRHYTGDNQPKVLVSFISEFGVGAATIGNDTLGIGLDMFMGSEFSAYDPNLFPAFISRHMRPDKIVPNLIKAMGYDLVGEPSGIRMLDVMIQQGKVLYLMDLVLPATPDSVKIDYTTEQWQWVEDNETQIWSHFLSQELLYNTNRQDIQKLIGPSPNAPNMPAEAPGQTATWTGWQIIRRYMEKHPEITIPELMADKDAQAILEKSKYRPR